MPPGRRAAYACTCMARVAVKVNELHDSLQHHRCCGLSPSGNASGPPHLCGPASEASAAAAFWHLVLRDPARRRWAGPRPCWLRDGCACAGIDACMRISAWSVSNGNADVLLFSSRVLNDNSLSHSDSACYKECLGDGEAGRGLRRWTAHLVQRLEFHCWAAGACLLPSGYRSFAAVTAIL